MTVQWATWAAGASSVSAQNARTVAHPLGRLDEHPAELPAADHTQRGRGIETGRGCSGVDRSWAIAEAGSSSYRRLSHGVGLSLAEARSASRIAGYFRQDGRRQQPGVGRSRSADGQRAHRDPARHLDDREQRIDPAAATLLSTGTPSTGRIEIAASIPAGGPRRRRRR